MKISNAFLGIGSNMGDKQDNLQQAIKLLQQSDDIDVVRMSSLYETEPVGYEDQAWFLNLAVEIKTAFTPYELLDYCQLIERNLKRERNIRWGPRTIDMDILLYEDVYLNDDTLTIPHPRMKERGFVLIPLQEIAPGLIIEGVRIDKLIDLLSGDEVRKCGELQRINVK